jgi:hypothetical protein
MTHGCKRSHPHENMDAICELKTEIARLTNKLANLKQNQADPVAWADHGVVNWIVDKQFKHAAYLYEGAPPKPSKACVYCGQLVNKEGL